MDIFGEDKIVISEHEFETYKKALEHNADFIIARVYISRTDLYSYYYSYLQYDETRDVFFDPDRDIEYTRIEENNKIVYCNLGYKPLIKRRGFTLENM